MFCVLTICLQELGIVLLPMSYNHMPRRYLKSRKEKNVKVKHSVYKDKDTV